MDNGLFSQDIVSECPPSLAECLSLLGVSRGKSDQLPFAPGDTTAGTENELQVAVAGSRHDVDLPRQIESSSYFTNIVRRSRSGDTSPLLYRNLERFLSENREGVWENSWVRMPYRYLNSYAQSVLSRDLKSVKSDPNSTCRSDIDTFFYLAGDEKWLRVPVSYLLKLALADALGEEAVTCKYIQQTGRRLMDHFLNDNTSPETFSFYVVSQRNSPRLGDGIAREAAKRYLLSQILLQYANEKFSLERNGQQAILFSSPHPPIRQRRLNESISDSFYRELFMSPCLSGWDNGEDKYRYMHLCHQVLSRSHLNAVMKLREAGIVTNNLVVLPHTSNISLANNGTHISMGSKKLSRLMNDSSSGFTARHEKYLGDLAAKIMEHFLPLFVGTYSAAPYRVDYEDFHPEKLLGFLAHQLDDTHLRMLWRRWKRKARNSMFGHAMTPFGPLPLDSFIGKIFRLKGDLVPDFRLIDYPVSFLSTERNCCQDGRLGNDIRLKEDLDALGIFDKRMSLYQLYKLRDFSSMGFSGFEARYYSLFEHFGKDMGMAAQMQMLLNALTFKLICSGKIRHDNIPDSPFVESERRQIFFGVSINLPTFFVRKNTSNAFLVRILKQVKKSRTSRRYPGYIRVYNVEYRRALLKVIRQEGADLIELFNMEDAVDDLEKRIMDVDHSCCGRLIEGITGEKINCGRAFLYSSSEFNSQAEAYYRGDLRLAHMKEAWGYFVEDIEAMKKGNTPLPVELRSYVHSVVGTHDTGKILQEDFQAITNKTLPVHRLLQLISLLLFSVEAETAREKVSSD